MCSVRWEDYGIRRKTWWVLGQGLYEANGFTWEQTSSTINPTSKDSLQVAEEVEVVLEPLPEVKQFTGSIRHTWYPEDSLAQRVVSYAYELGGLDFVLVFECENWTYDMNRLGDHGHAHGLCQINDHFHKNIPAEYFTDWKFAVEYCYQKWKSGTPFYGPTTRRTSTKWMMCKDYVLNRFVINA